MLLRAWIDPVAAEYKGEFDQPIKPCREPSRQEANACAVQATPALENGGLVSHYTEDQSILATVHLDHEASVPVQNDPYFQNEPNSLSFPNGVGIGDTYPAWGLQQNAEEQELVPDVRLFLVMGKATLY